MLWIDLHVNRLFHHYFMFSLFFKKKNLEDMSPFCDTPVLNFWRRLLWVLKPEWVLPYSHLAEAYVLHVPWDLPLVLHLLYVYPSCSYGNSQYPDQLKQIFWLSSLPWCVPIVWDNDVTNALWSKIWHPMSIHTVPSRLPFQHVAFVTSICNQ